MSPKAASYPNLTGFRFFTCMHVVVYHLFKPMAVAVGAPMWAQNLLRASTFGFFFVLSGFLLASAYGDKVGTEPGRRKFWLRRFARIVPLYLVVLAVAFPIAWMGAASHGGHATVLKALLANLVLMQAWFQSLVTTINTPAWSISVEMTLYALFPLLVPIVRGLHRRLGFYPLFLLLLALQGLNIAFLGLHEGWAALGAIGKVRSFGLYWVSFNPISWIPPFTMGLLLGFRLKEQAELPPMRGWTWVVLGAALSVALFLALAPTRLVLLARVGLFSLPFSTVIYLLARGSQVATPLNRALGWGPLQRFGAATYSVYVIHVPLWDYLQVGLARLTHTPSAAVGENPWFAFGYLVVLAVFGVWVCEHIEQPLTRWAGERLKRFQPKTPARPLAATPESA